MQPKSATKQQKGSEEIASLLEYHIVNLSIIVN